MKRAVSIAEAKAKFAECVREAETGEPVVITRHGRVVAGVVSADDLAAVRAHRAQRTKGGLLELRNLAGMAGLVDDVDDTIAKRGDVRQVQGLD